MIATKSDTLIWRSNPILDSWLDDTAGSKKYVFLLLRRKPPPDGWFSLSPSQRSRSDYGKQERFGADQPVVLVKAYKSRDGAWKWGLSSSTPQSGLCSDLEGYEWILMGPTGKWID